MKQLSDVLIRLSRLLLGPTRAVSALYASLGLTYLILETDRYIHARPADALFLEGSTLVLAVVGIPVWTIVWWCTSLSVFWYFGIAITLLFAPPLLTTGLLEFDLGLKRRKDR